MFRKYLCLTVLIMVFNFLPFLQAEEETKYVFAFPPHSLLGLSSTEVMGLLKPMTDHLGKELGSPMELRAVADYQVFLKDLGKGEIDIAIADIPLYLKARKDFGVIPLVKFDVTYRGILVTSATSNIRKIERAKGKTLACCSRYSMAGYFFPRSLLAEKHLGEIESFFRSIKITGKDSQSLQSLITGEVDIASVSEPTYFIMVKRLPVLGTFLKGLLKNKIS